MTSVSIARSFVVLVEVTIAGAGWCNTGVGQLRMERAVGRQRGVLRVASAPLSRSDSVPDGNRGRSYCPTWNLLGIRVAI
jgi:hypothetical protein